MVEESWQNLVYQLLQILNHENLVILPADNWLELRVFQNSIKFRDEGWCMELEVEHDI